MFSLLRGLLRRDGSASHESAPAAGGSSAAGQVVTTTSAMRASTVFTCVRVLTEFEASLPLNAYTGRAPGAEMLTDGPLARMLRDGPNLHQTSQEFRSQIALHRLMSGNAFVEIVRRGSDGAAIELWPVDPSCVTVRLNERRGLEYKIRDGRIGNRVVAQDKIAHYRGLSLDGIWGVSPISFARDTVGMQLAEQRFSGDSFSGGLAGVNVLTRPQESAVLNEEGERRLARSFSEAVTNARAQGGAIVLQEGTEAKRVGLSHADAQLIESRQMTRSEIAAVFGVPNHMVGDMSKATWANIEHQTLQFYRDCLHFWLTRSEGSWFKQVLSPRQRRGVILRHDVSQLLRGDLKATSEYLARLTNSGVLMLDEARVELDRPPLPDGFGSRPRAPVNISDLDSSDQQGSSNASV